MANGNRNRTRSKRVSTVELPPGFFGRTLSSLRQGHILIRIGLCACAALVLWGITQAWSPPLTYYEGYVPARDIHASVPFNQPDPTATLEAKRQAGELALAVYSNDDKLLTQVRARLMNTVNKVLGADSIQAVGSDEWSQFLAPPEHPPKAPPQPGANKKSAPVQHVTLKVASNIESADSGEETSEPFLPKSVPKSKKVTDNSKTLENRKPMLSPNTAESGTPIKPTLESSGSENVPAEEKQGDTKPTNDKRSSKNSPRTDSNEIAAPTKPQQLEANSSKSKSPLKNPAVPKAEKQIDPATARFLEFKAAFAEPDSVKLLQSNIEEIFEPFEQHGILEKLPDAHAGNQERILVYPQGDTRVMEPVSIRDVLAANSATLLQERIKQVISSPIIAESISNWLKGQLPSTLSIDPVATKNNRELKQNEVAEVEKPYLVGSILAYAGKPIDEDQLALLELEHGQLLEERSLTAKAGRSLAAMGMYLALYTLCGFYVYRREPELLSSLPRMFTMLCLVVGTVTLSVVLKGWSAELVPLLLFSMAVAIAYHQELALLLAAAVMLIVVTALGRDLTSGIVLLGATYGAILLLRNVRTRTKLLFVGLGSGAVALLTTLGMGCLMGQPWGELIRSGMLSFGLCVLAGTLMTVLLPFIERAFGVLTDISLLELGDAAHPLLQELIRRAPGTYNHSITVALLAEAAAESIGARGLLVRVGAFFHDIGKMLKPGYFIENQGQGGNRHDSLVPAMSTLVIIAHVKDGADLARQNRLPETIIDFIQQHHGTTLVEYFYRRANEQKVAEEGSEVDESSFRYPGPKPQTKEAGVLMLADAVESASRVLVEPTPARIESLVEELTMKRLLDGQFDECGLTLQEVHMIGESLVKSLTGVYHGRVKYPGQQTA